MVRFLFIGHEQLISRVITCLITWLTIRASTPFGFHLMPVLSADGNIPAGWFLAVNTQGLQFDHGGTDSANLSSRRIPKNVIVNATLCLTRVLLWARAEHACAFGTLSGTSRISCTAPHGLGLYVSCGQYRASLVVVAQIFQNMPAIVCEGHVGQFLSQAKTVSLAGSESHHPTST